MAFQVDCENCHQPVPANNLELSTGWAKCPFCNHVFPIADAVPTFPRPEELQQRGQFRDPNVDAAVVTERPFDAKALVEERNDSLLIHIPAQGMTAATWGLMFFALFWNGFILFWTGGALFGVVVGGGRGLIGPALCFPLFSIPFWVVGAILIGAVAWMRFGTKSVHLDASDMNVQSRCLFWKRHRHVPREDVQCARVAEIKIRTESGRPVGQNNLEIVYAGGTYSLAGASLQERDWLITTINRFLKRTARV